MTTPTPKNPASPDKHAAALARRRANNAKKAAERRAQEAARVGSVPEYVRRAAEKPRPTRAPAVLRHAPEPEEPPPPPAPSDMERKLRGHRVCQFISRYVQVPEGWHVGQKMELLPEQVDFVSRVYNNVDDDGHLITRRGIMSIARKNGKTGLISALLEAHLIGPEAKQNSQIYSGARSRDQAALVFNYAAKSLRLNNDLEGLVQITDSSKKIVGLARNVQYRALSADATTAHGLSPALTIHDELGQVVGPTDGLYDALETAGGAQVEPLSLIISTQAASDMDLLSTLIDDMLRNPRPENVLCLYAASKDDDIFDPKVWHKTNFALGKFRSEKEFAEAAARAKRMPSFEATFRNLYLNMRVALASLFIAPSVWKECAAEVDLALFKSGEEVHIGLDLSSTTDLTACVLSCKDPNTGIVHLLPYVFTPMYSLEERTLRDRAPYTQWADEGYLIAVPSKTVDYGFVAEYMAKETEDMNLASLQFDRWRISHFRKEAERYGFAQADTCKWAPVGQGFKDMSPRLEVFEKLLLNSMLAHGGNPLLNMSAANAIAIKDPAGNRKLEKAKSSARIDPLVGALMAAYPCEAPLLDEEEQTVITTSSLFFLG